MKLNEFIAREPKFHWYVTEALPVECAQTIPRLTIRRENTETDAGAREIELNALACCAVSRLLKRAERLGAVAPEHYLFPADLSRHTRMSDPLLIERGYDPSRHQQRWRTAWRSIICAAGPRWVRFHDLRHTAITTGREQGVDIGILKAIAGHMDTRMTQYYSHIGSTVRRHALDRIGEAYRPVMELLGIAVPGHSSVQ